MKRTALISPLPLSLTQSQERMARCCSGRLDSIGVKLEMREGRVLATTLPAIITSQSGCPTVTADVVQVHQMWHVCCTD